jgi:GntR family transcriptional regulator, negative regulator for fad regulon and positive regulator of fabA
MTTYQLDSEIRENWRRIRKPAHIAENRLIEAILDRTFPINSNLPGERELAESLGVTRPTLRETLQRLERDGWVEIHQGKPTRVRDYWREGKLGVLNTIAASPEHLPDKFVDNLLAVRLAMAPAYTALAVENQPEAIIQLMETRHTLGDDPQEFAHFDWQVHHDLTILSENPVFVMILNGFKDLYRHLAPIYFSINAARQHSMHFYQDLSQASARRDPNQARILTDMVMRESMIFWQQTKLS